MFQTLFSFTYTEIRHHTRVQKPLVAISSNFLISGKLPGKIRHLREISFICMYTRVYTHARARVRTRERRVRVYACKDNQKISSFLILYNNRCHLEVIQCASKTQKRIITELCKIEDRFPFFFFLSFISRMYRYINIRVNLYIDYT